jgi:hypothetical protein
MRNNTRSLRQLSQIEVCRYRRKTSLIEPLLTAKLPVATVQSVLDANNTEGVPHDHE